MKIQKGLSGQLLFVFPNQDDADKWRWLFHGILHMQRCCAGQYDNAYCRNSDIEVDAECDRILAMTDQEITAELIAQGLDPDIEAKKVKSIFEIAVADAKFKNWQTHG